METEEIFAELRSLAEALGIVIRGAALGEDSSDHPGGAVVRLRGKEILFLNSSACLEDRIEALAKALARRPELADRFLPPQVRAVLDDAAGT